MALLTVGHGPDGRDQLGKRLGGAGVRLVVDVRRFPASRTNPDVATDALAAWLPAIGIGYRWDERLGGRRRLPAGARIVDGWWTVAQFAAYAAYTRTPEFVAALNAVLADADADADAHADADAEADAAVVAVMCSESVWWRCHRRLIADVAVLAHGVRVQHLMPDGRLTQHRPAEGAVLGPDGLVRWPG
jgi:uncharacterized protein (DUF488 family)